jgi:hypothetical protein
LLVWQFIPGQFMAQASVVNRSEQAGAETAVYPHREADDAVGEVSAVDESGLHWADPVSGPTGSAILVKKRLRQ